jgi:hypothetical protein
MDPEQALKDGRAVCREWLDDDDKGDVFDQMQRLVDAFEALDQWLSKGGALPRAWGQK